MSSRCFNAKWTQLDRDEAMQAAKEPNKRIKRLIDNGYSIKHNVHTRLLNW